MTDDQARQTRAGFLYGIAAYVAWGLFPIYFKGLAGVPPVQIVAHRIIWSLLVVTALASLWKRWPGIGVAFRDRRTLATLALTSALIAVNWLAYVWAIVSGHVLEASLGYYLNPLVNVLLGTLLLKERLSRPQIAAVVLAAAGVAVLAAGAGDALWVSLTLAVSFGLYGFFRKIAPVDALEGLALETMILAPLCLAWVLWLETTGQGSLFAGGWTTALLILSGAVTAGPLLWFTAAARRLPYSTLGFLQYIGPTMQFFCAVVLFGEHMTRAHAICFAAIWTALAIFIGDSLRRGRAAALARAATAASQG